MQGGLLFFLGGVFGGWFLFVSFFLFPPVWKVPGNCLCWQEIRKREVMIYDATRLLSFTCMYSAWGWGVQQNSYRWWAISRLDTLKLEVLTFVHKITVRKIQVNLIE